jgi:hypothetical protein
LSNLERLDLHENRLYSELPTHMDQLITLKKLRLHGEPNEFMSCRFISNLLPFLLSLSIAKVLLPGIEPPQVVFAVDTTTHAARCLSILFSFLFNLHCNLRFR